MSRKRYTDRDKKRILRQFDAHTGSIASFCRESGISAATLDRWRKQAGITFPTDGGGDPTDFVEFEFGSLQRPHSTLSPLVELELHGGITLRIFSPLAQTS